MKLLVFSDPHLSGTHPFFYFNWVRMKAILAQEAPDRVICCGDMAQNGASAASDLAFARAEFDQIGQPWHVVPGNHDVGNAIPDVRGEHEISSDRIALYRSHFGPDYWSVDVDGWRLIGMNALTPGSGLPEDAAQTEWLDSVLATDRPVALFLHKPLFRHRVDEEGLHQGALYPEPRAALRAKLAGSSVRLVVSGHNHERAEKTLDGIDHQWCPAISFVIVSGAPADGRGGGERRPGYLRISLDGAGHSVEQVFPPEFLLTDIGGWLSGGIGLYQRFTTEPFAVP